MKNNKGYTIVEALIAMLLVAIVVGGIFSALMASRRAISEPSSREDTYFAAEDVLNTLRECTSAQSEDANPSNEKYLPKCSEILPSGSGQVWQMFEDGEHNVDEKKLPDSCTDSSSKITYSVSKMAVEDPTTHDVIDTLSVVKLNVVCNKAAKL